MNLLKKLKLEIEEKANCKYYAGDVNLLKTSGLYYVDGSSSNIPVATYSAYVTVNAKNDGNYLYQEAEIVSSNTEKQTKYKRQCFNGEWTEWVQLLQNTEIKEWTPTLDNCTAAYTVRKGNYVKVGNLVHFEFQLQGEITAVDSTAYAFISGLPLAKYSFDTSGSCHEALNVLASGRPMPTLRIALNGGKTKLALQKSDGMGTSIESWVAGRGKFYLSGSGTYIVN